MRIPLDPAAVAPTPWRNGGGATREHHHVTDAVGATLWRVSVADLVAESAFSVFPGLRRLFVPLAALVLVIDGEEVALGAREQIEFEGEQRVLARVFAPTRALNVMTRRGAFVATAAIVDDTVAEVEIRERTSPTPEDLPA